MRSDCFQCPDEIETGCLNCREGGGSFAEGSRLHVMGDVSGRWTEGVADGLKINHKGGLAAFHFAQAGWFGISWRSDTSMAMAGI
jgi:hypothetical protein